MYVEMKSWPYTCVCMFEHVYLSSICRFYMNCEALFNYVLKSAIQNTILLVGNITSSPEHICICFLLKSCYKTCFNCHLSVVSMCAPLSVSSILQSIEMLQTTQKLRWYNFLLMKLRILLKKLNGFWRIRVGLYFIQCHFLSILSSLRPFSYIFYLEKSVQWAILHVFCDDHHRLAWEEKKNKINNKILHVNKQIFWNHSFDISWKILFLPFI